MDALTIGLQIAGPLLGALAEEIAAGIRGGKSEEEATRDALRRLADMPDLVPVLPEVRRLIAEARRPKAERT